MYIPSEGAMDYCSPQMVSSCENINPNAQIGQQNPRKTQIMSQCKCKRLLIESPIHILVYYSCPTGINY